MHLVSLLPFLLLTASPALAALEARFVESAPKDSFVLTNTGACGTGPMEVTVDLTGTAGGLIFDVTGSGAGVSVFQPFEVTDGAEALVALPDVADGDRAVTLRFADLPAGATLRFTIDVDDTAGQSETRVAGGEIAGGVLRVAITGQTREAGFGPDARALVMIPACLS